MGAVSLETKRLILRLWREEDAQQLYELCRDPEIGPAAGWPAHRSVEESLEVIRNVFDPDRTWAVTLRGEDLAIGCVGLKPTTAVSGDEPELGYWVGRVHWGNGYIPEAAGAVLEHCFTALGARRVWCAHYEGNERSRRVIEKCGFVPALSRIEDVKLMNEQRLCHYYALTAQQWRARREERL